MSILHCSLRSFSGSPDTPVFFRDGREQHGKRPENRSGMMHEAEWSVDRLKPVHNQPPQTGLRQLTGTGLHAASGRLRIHQTACENRQQEMAAGQAGITAQTAAPAKFFSVQG